MLRTTTIGLPAASTRSASRWSWRVTPLGGVDHEEGQGGLVDGPQAPAPSSSTRPLRLLCVRRRMPAVSMNRTGPSGVSTRVSMASLVVPGMSCTMARSSPIRRLKRVDLPTLGRPTMATEIGFEPLRGLVHGHFGLSAPASSGPPAACGLGRRGVAPACVERQDQGVEQFARAPAVQRRDGPGLSKPERRRTPRFRPPEPRCRPC